MLQKTCFWKSWSLYSSTAWLWNGDFGDHRKSQRPFEQMLRSSDKKGEIQSVCVSLFVHQQSFWILNLLNCTNRSLLCLFIPWETSGHITLCLLWDVPLGHLSFGRFRDVVVCHQGHSAQQTPGLGCSLVMLFLEHMGQAGIAKGMYIGGEAASDIGAWEGDDS